ncbi:MAG: ABC transporter permease subunit, partial [Candidatus Heimdallarchaeota archaeon]|nr:ABC transporter permease subunit [Candidatus Heimdallarchaeota archaeon]
MNAQVAIFRNELRSNRGWYLSWIITSISLSFMYMATYPGLDGMQTILDLLDEPVFQAFVGDIGGESPGLALWMALTVSTMVLLFAIAATLTGAKVIAQSLSDNTGEIIHSLPISRTQFLTSRLLAGLFAMILMLLGWVVPLLIPI